MEIMIDDAGSTATVKMIGRLDIAGSEVVAAPLATLPDNTSKLIFDMAAVTFVASIGIRHLVMAARTVWQRGGRVILLNPVAAVAEVITTSGLTGLLPIEYDAAAPG